MTTRKYSSTASPTTLAAGCTSSATTIQVVATTGFPAVDFVLALDYGAVGQELVLVTNVSGTVLTVTRGYDSTAAVAHSLGAAVQHVHAGADFRDSRNHEAATAGVHGVTGSVVGTTDTQALSNKDLSSNTNTLPANVVTADGDQTLTNKTITTPKIFQIRDENNLTAFQFNPIAGAVNYLASIGSVSGSAVVLAAAGIDANITLSLIPKGTGTVKVAGVDVATVSATQTLTNKTLTSPTINTPAITGGTQASPAITSPSVTGLTLDGVNVSGAWQTYVPALTASTSNPTLGAGPVQLGRYSQVGKTITCQGKIVFGAGSTAGTGTYRIGLPVPANIAAWNDRRIGQATIYQSSSGNQAMTFAALDPAGGGFFTLAYLTALPASNAISVASAAPWAWAAGDSLWWSVTYETA